MGRFGCIALRTSRAPGAGIDVGLGWMGQLPLSALYAYAIALFALQVAWSHGWLARHAQGAVEALSRRLTYPQVAKAAVGAAVS